MQRQFGCALQTAFDTVSVLPQPQVVAQVPEPTGPSAAAGWVTGPPTCVDFQVGPSLLGEQQGTAPNDWAAVWSRAPQGFGPDARLGTPGGMLPIGDYAGTMTDPNTGITYATFTQAMPEPIIPIGGDMALPPTAPCAAAAAARTLEALTGNSALTSRPCRQEMNRDWADALEGAQIPAALLQQSVNAAMAGTAQRDTYFTNRETPKAFPETDWAGYIGTSYVLRVKEDTQTVQDYNGGGTTNLPFRPNPDLSLAVPMYHDPTRIGGPRGPLVRLLAEDKVTGPGRPVRDDVEDPRARLTFTTDGSGGRDNTVALPGNLFAGASPAQGGLAPAPVAATDSARDSTWGSLAAITQLNTSGWASRGAALQPATADTSRVGLSAGPVQVAGPAVPASAPGEVWMPTQDGTRGARPEGAPQRTGAAHLAGAGGASSSLTPPALSHLPRGGGEAMGAGTQPQWQSPTGVASTQPGPALDGGMRGARAADAVPLRAPGNPAGHGAAAGLLAQPAGLRAGVPHTTLPVASPAAVSADGALIDYSRLSAAMGDGRVQPLEEARLPAAPRVPDLHGSPAAALAPPTMPGFQGFTDTGPVRPTRDAVPITGSQGMFPSASDGRVRALEEASSSAAGRYVVLPGGAAPPAQSLPAAAPDGRVQSLEGANTAAVRYAAHNVAPVALPSAMADGRTRALEEAGLSAAGRYVVFDAGSDAYTRPNLMAAGPDGVHAAHWDHVAQGTRVAGGGEWAQAPGEAANLPSAMQDGLRRGTWTTAGTATRAQLLHTGVAQGPSLPSALPDGVGRAQEVGSATRVSIAGDGSGNGSGVNLPMAALDGVRAGRMAPHTLPVAAPWVGPATPSSLPAALEGGARTWRAEAGLGSGSRPTLALPPGVTVSQPMVAQQSGDRAARTYIGPGDAAYVGRAQTLFQNDALGTYASLPAAPSRDRGDRSNNNLERHVNHLSLLREVMLAAHPTTGPDTRSAYVPPPDSQRAALGAVADCLRANTALAQCAQINRAVAEQTYRGTLPALGGGVADPLCDTGYETDC